MSQTRKIGPYDSKDLLQNEQSIYTRNLKRVLDNFYLGYIKKYCEDFKVATIVDYD